jgi:hypothetical protein
MNIYLHVYVNAYIHIYIQTFGGITCIHGYDRLDHICLLLIGSIS